jgi:hypothetical protein
LHYAKKQAIQPVYLGRILVWQVYFTKKEKQKQLFTITIKRNLHKQKQKNALNFCV